MNWFTKIFKNKDSEEIKYNKTSAQVLEWKPKWFKSSTFDESLIEEVKRFQRKYNIEPTGLVDTSTYRRKMAEKDAISSAVKVAVGNHIFCNNKAVKIDWDKVVTFHEELKWAIPSENYNTWGRHRMPNMFMVHWDVCLSSERCHKILKKRGLSVHFMIDNDGTIIQTMDTQDVAWHAGNRNVNEKSIGVEISNAYYTKFQGTYEMNGFGPRPICEDVEVHGRRLEPFLGFYPVQLEALKALIKSLNKAHNIPFDVPLDQQGNLATTTNRRVVQGKFRGVVNHLHRDKKKIDCAGLKLDEIVADAKEEQ